MVAFGMERGVRDSGDRLDDLLAKLQAHVYQPAFSPTPSGAQP